MLVVLAAVALAMAGSARPQEEAPDSARTPGSARGWTSTTAACTATRPRPSGDEAPRRAHAVHRDGELSPARRHRQASRGESLHRVGACRRDPCRRVVPARVHVVLPRSAAIVGRRALQDAARAAVRLVRARHRELGSAQREAAELQAARLARSAEPPVRAILRSARSSRPRAACSRCRSTGPASRTRSWPRSTTRFCRWATTATARARCERVRLHRSQRRDHPPSHGRSRRADPPDRRRRGLFHRRPDARFVRAARECGVIGASLYDWGTTTAAHWSSLNAVKRPPAPTRDC